MNLQIFRKEKLGLFFKIWSFYRRAPADRIHFYDPSIADLNYPSNSASQLPSQYSNPSIPVALQGERATMPLSFYLEFLLSLIIDREELLPPSVSFKWQCTLTSTDLFWPFIPLFPPPFPLPSSLLSSFVWRNSHLSERPHKITSTRQIRPSEIQI